METPAPTDSWRCSGCNGRVNETKILIFKVRPGRLTRIWHPACKR